MTDYPLFHGYDNVVVTPHLGASTAEATDRAGYQSRRAGRRRADRRRRLDGRQHPLDRRRGHGRCSAPFLPMARQLGRLAMALAEGSSVERIEAAFMGRIADFDTRLLDARRDRRRP